MPELSLEDLETKRIKLQSELDVVVGQIRDHSFVDGMFMSAHAMKEEMGKCPEGTPVLIEVVKNHQDWSEKGRRTIYVDNFVGNAEFVQAHWGEYKKNEGVFVITASW